MKKALLGLSMKKKKSGTGTVKKMTNGTLTSTTTLKMKSK